MTRVSPSGIEFDAANPLDVVIEPHNRPQWDIQVSSSAIFKPDQQLQSKKMFQRIDLKSIEAEWRTRRVPTAPALPHFLGHGNHIPIVVRTGETVQFTCQRPFMIWAHRDPNVTVRLQSPENPFGWSTEQKAELRGVLYEVIAQAAANISEQRFYKCTAWIELDTGNPLLVDPDVIGL